MSSPSKCEACRKKAIFFSRAQQLSPDKFCSACAAAAVEINNTTENNENNITPIFNASLEAEISESKLQDTIQLDGKPSTINRKSSWSNLFILFIIFILSIITGVLLNHSIIFVKSYLLSKFLT